MARSTPPPIPGPRPAGFVSVLAAAVGAMVGSALRQAGEMVELLVEVLVSAVRRPVGYWGDVRVGMVETLASCWITMVIATGVFGFTVGINGSQGYLSMGVPERMGSFFLATGVREFCPWINAIVVAGAAGTMLTADLGTRRIRQEFDAMEVMEVDPVRDVVLPRVVALTLTTPLLSVFALLTGLLGGLGAAVATGAAPGAFWNSFWANASPIDIAVGVLKSVAFGLTIGVVCGYKGYRVPEGGPGAVGRAVNQSVVIALAVIWITNLVVSTLVLGVFPQMTDAR